MAAKWLRNGAKMRKKQGEKKRKKREIGRVASIVSFLKTPKKQQFRKFLFVKIFTNSL